MAEYYDNRKKYLYKQFNVKLIHPITENYLELDRYYPKYRVAIEIQGDQHHKECEYFAAKKNKTPKEYLEEIQMVDEAKRNQCDEQGIILIALDAGMTQKDIIQKVGMYLPIRKEPLRDSSESYESLGVEIIGQLQKLQSNKDSFITKSDVVTFSRPLYDDIRLIFKGMYNAREAAGILQPPKKKIN